MDEGYSLDPVGLPLQCNFIHKRLYGAGKGFLTGGFTGAATGFVTKGLVGAVTNGAPATPAVRLDPTSRIGRELSGSPCAVGFARDTRGDCQPLSTFSGVGGVVARRLPGGSTGRIAVPDVGDAVMGRYGAALHPFVEDRMVRSCLPGMVLGNDGLCYNKRDLTNKERQYPKGRAPLLTGGERNAISKASRAAKKIERTTKQLYKLGMIKKPTARRAPAPKADHHHHP
jgi:hypothetical protein